MFGLNEKGFNRKTYPDILEDMQVKTRELFGEDINLSSLSLMGMFLRVISWTLSIIWQLAENVYNSAYIDSAEGVGLDRLGMNIGVPRLGKQHAEGKVTLKCEVGATIPAGFIVANGRDIEYITNTETVATQEETTINVRSIFPGSETNSEVGEVTEIITPTSGVDEIISNTEIIGGKDTETDDEYRMRYYDSLYKTGASTTNSIASTLLQLDGVKGALVVENDTNNVDSDGRPPHCIHAYVVGGDKHEIGLAIFENKAGGIEPYGDVEVTIKDIAGHDRKVAFSYASEKPINVDIKLRKDKNFHKNGDTQVKDAVIKYIGGIDSQGVERKGLAIGQDVIISQLVRELWRIDGIVDVEVKIGTDETSDKNIIIDKTEVAITGNVVIEHE